MKTKISKREAKLNAEIKRRNAKFAKMSPAQKRVAIAEDVLAQLKRKKFTAEAGQYCTVNYKKAYYDKKEVGMEGEVQKQVELQPLLLNGTVESCNVCAIGSVFMSKVSLANKFKVTLEEDWWDTNRASFESDLDNDNEMVKHMRGIFTEKQLRFMEYVFEGRDVDDLFVDKSDKFHDKVIAFGEKYPTDDAKLKAIMKNIIENKGNFKI